MEDSELFYKNLKKSLSKVFPKIQDKMDKMSEQKRRTSDTMFYSAVFWSIYNFAENNRTMLQEQEAIQKYSNRAIATQEKNYIMDLMTYINVENLFEFQIDKKLFCKLLGIEVQTYQFLLKEKTFPSNPVFEDIEEFLISVKQNAAETNSRNASAIAKNLTTDSKFNGHDVTYADKREEKKPAVVINYSDNASVKKSLSKFNFDTLEAPKTLQEQQQENTPPKQDINPFE